MGNLCGKESKPDDPFKQPGRTLASAPPPSSGTSKLPPGASTTPKISGPGRTLGASGRSDTGDARRAAAQAAEERARANQPKGKLSTQLAAQKQQRRTDTLGQASENERRLRDADASAEARNWN
ncbi:MAG: hypothetical protein M1835_006710 [Candelina submexicana]|nr:MAG: hypothetical protein M1835_006710 [Candelina submexicana]